MTYFNVVLTSLGQRINEKQCNETKSIFQRAQQQAKWQAIVLVKWEGRLSFARASQLTWDRLFMGFFFVKRKNKFTALWFFWNLLTLYHRHRGFGSLYHVLFEVFSLLISSSYVMLFEDLLSPTNLFAVTWHTHTHTQTRAHLGLCPNWLYLLLRLSYEMPSSFLCTCLSFSTFSLYRVFAYRSVCLNSSKAKHFLFLNNFTGRERTRPC